MRRLGGYIITTGPDGTTESDSITCAHCNCIVPVPVGRLGDVAAWCYRCDASICRKKACGTACVPFEKALDAYERRRAFREVLESRRA